MLRVQRFRVLCQAFKVNENLVQVSALHSSLSARASEAQSNDENNSSQIEINPTYENKNPRNLEWSGHQIKPAGWNLQFPPRDFYHQVRLKVHDKTLEAVVEHASGRKVIQVTSKDPIVRQFLYSSRDNSAAMNLGRIMADRCLQYGIDQLKYLQDQSTLNSSKEAIFREALINGGLKLEEPEFIEQADSTVGLDYDDVNFFHERRDVPFPPKINKFIKEKLNKQNVE